MTLMKFKLGFIITDLFKHFAIHMVDGGLWTQDIR